MNNLNLLYVCLIFLCLPQCIYSFDPASNVKESQLIKKRFMDDIYKVEKATFNYLSNPSFYDSISDDINNLGIDEKIISELNDDELDKAFSKMFRLNSSKNFQLTIFENLFNEKDRRGILKKRDKDLITMVLIGQRDFDKLKTILKKYNIKSDISDMDIEPFSSKKDIKYLVYDIKDLKKADLINLPIDEGRHIVFVMLLSCGNAEIALDSIIRNSLSLRIFKRYGKIITLDFSPQSILYTKKHYYNFSNIYSAYNHNSFKNFNLDVSPGIYFVKNGKILSYTNGWDRDNGIDEFIKKSKELGFDSADDIINLNDKDIKHKLVPKVGDLLSKIPDKEKIDFLNNIRLVNGIVSYFDYDILSKYYDNSEMIDMYDHFMPFAVELNKYKGTVNEYKLGDVIKDLPDDEREKFVLSLQIDKGFIVGCGYFTPIIDLSAEKQRDFKCKVFGCS